MTQKWLRYGLIIMASWLGACQRGKPTQATLLVLPDLAGVVAPCGCTSRPLGGLERLAGLVQRYRQQGPVATVAMGDTLFGAKTKDTVVSQIAQEPRKAQAIAHILFDLPLGLWVPGRADLEAHPEFSLSKLLQQIPLPRVRGDIAIEIMTLGPFRIGLLGAPTLPDQQLLQQASINARDRGAQVVVLLLATPLPTNAVLRKTVDIVFVAGSGQKAVSTSMVDQVVAVSGGQWGEVVDVVHFVTNGKSMPATLPFVDTLKSEQQTLKAKIARLDREIAALASGPAQSARINMRQRLQQTLTAAASASLPKEHYFTISSVELDESVPQATLVAAQLAAYHRSLCATLTQLPCPPPPASPQDSYAGSMVCAGCHAEAMATYQKTAHSHAWQTLTHIDKQCDASCVGCHVVGYNQPGGFCREETTPHLVQVGCESCHGPAAAHSQHSENPKLWSQHFVARPNNATCQQCHTPEHSDLYRFADYLPRILGPGHWSKQP